MSQLRSVNLIVELLWSIMHVQILFYLPFKIAAFALFRVWVFWSDAVFDPQNNIFYCNRDCSSQAARHIEHSSLNYSGQPSSTRESVFIANKQTICRRHLPAAVLLCGCVRVLQREEVFFFICISYVFIHTFAHFYFLVYLFILLALRVDPPQPVRFSIFHPHRSQHPL